MIIEKQPGEILIEFLNLDLNPYRYALDEFNELLKEILSESLTEKQYRELYHSTPRYGLPATRIRFASGRAHIGTHSGVGW